MPVYLIVSQTPSGQDMRAIVASDLADAAQQIKAAGNGSAFFDDMEGA